MPEPLAGPRIRIDDDAGVRDVRIDNPDKRNALTRELLGEIIAALPTAPAGPDQPVRVVVLRGEPGGRAFSSGFDIAAIDHEERAAGLDPIRAPADAIEACPVPVIAALDGPAFGGGLEVAMACHMRVCTRDARLAMPPARLGLVYSPAGLARFLRCVSPSQVNRLFLTGTPVLGEEAARIGLVDAVVDGEGAATRLAMEWARQIAANAPLAVDGLLDAIRRLARTGAADPQDLAAIEESRDRTIRSQDLQEGVRAFLEKRPPVFVGE